MVTFILIFPMLFSLYMCYCCDFLSFFSFSYPLFILRLKFSVATLYFPAPFLSFCIFSVQPRSAFSLSPFFMLAFTPPFPLSVFSLFFFYFPPYSCFSDSCLPPAPTGPMYGLLSVEFSWFPPPSPTGVSVLPSLFAHSGFPLPSRLWYTIGMSYSCAFISPLRLPTRFLPMTFIFLLSPIVLWHTRFRVRQDRKDNLCSIFNLLSP